MEENFEKVLSINEIGEKYYDFKKLRFAITPFDAEEFEYLCRETDSSLEKVKGKHVLMLIGNTGAGKSTLIHYFSGSEMYGTKVEAKTGGELAHIGAKPLQMADPTLRNVEISPHPESCTRFIQTVQI
jgi:ABC-type polysaccharide/polyol phosphate transport system ATPase subunit